MVFSRKTENCYVNEDVMANSILINSFKFAHKTDMQHDVVFVWLHDVYDVSWTN